MSLPWWELAQSWGALTFLLILYLAFPLSIILFHLRTENTR